MGETDFRWNDWNLDHATKHGVSISDIEYVLRKYMPGFYRGDRYAVRGQTRSGYWIQVVYIRDPEGSVYVIHARPMTDKEKRNERKHR